MAKPLSQRDAWLEARRFRAWELKQQGWRQAEIAKELEVTPGAVSQWMKQAEQKGYTALVSRQGGGAKPRLTEDQLHQLPTLLTKGPHAYGLQGNVWTRNRIIAMIRQVFGVQYSHSHIGRILHKSGIHLSRSMISLEQARRRVGMHQ